MGDTIKLIAKPLVEQRTKELIQKVGHLNDLGISPLMRVVLVGNNPASLVYIRHKEKLCKKVGARFELIQLDEEVTEQDFLRTVEQANNDPDTTGLFIQLPLPKKLAHIDTTRLVSPQKDVDGFHFANIANLYSAKTSEQDLLPCTPRGIIELLKYYRISLEAKNAVIIGRSLIVGKPLFHMFLNENATVTLCHSRTKELQTITKNADIIVSAVGNPKWLTSDFINPRRNQILIDVGINRGKDGQLCGDMDQKDLIDKVAMLTPVPGGVGPLTVLCLISNLIQAAHNQRAPKAQG